MTRNAINQNGRKITLYRDDVKTFFWTANNSVLVISRYVNIADSEHYYIHWPRERFCWFKDEAAE